MIFCPLESVGGKISFGKSEHVMAAPIQNYDFPDARFGNTYDVVIFNLPELPPFSLAGAKIYLQLRKRAELNVTAEFSTENGKLEISSQYSFCFPEQVIEITADTYLYDILIIFTDERRETYIGGKWTIHPTITRKRQ